MKVVIDTSSLLSMVRYYLPFDKENRLYNLVKSKIESGDMILIDRIHKECKYISQGDILKQLSFLTDVKPHKTVDMIAPSPDKFMRQVENQFIRQGMRNLLTDIQFESQKTLFMNSADMGLILYSLNAVKHPNLFSEKIVILTEETEHNNDRKLFHKIPAICKILGITTMTLPELLGQCPDIEVSLK
jgi:hypothetical protein